MALKLNPITGKLDYFLHQGIASYDFVGWKELADPTDPGVGKMYFNEPDIYTNQLIVSPTDKYGNDVGYLLFDLMMFSEIYHVWLFFHSKRNPTVWNAILLYDVTPIVVDDEDVAYAIEISFFYLCSMKYDEEEGESIPTEFVENEEVLMSLEFAFNPEYIGTLGTQDYNNVSITGGGISGVSINTVNDVTIDLATKGLVLKDTQGTPHYWRVTISNAGVLVTTDLGT